MNISPLQFAFFTAISTAVVGGLAMSVLMLSLK